MQQRRNWRHSGHSQAGLRSGALTKSSRHQHRPLCMRLLEALRYILQTCVRPRRPASPLRCMQKKNKSLQINLLSNNVAHAGTDQDSVATHVQSEHVFVTRTISQGVVPRRYRNLDIVVQTHNTDQRRVTHLQSVPARREPSHVR